jgi:hypothetical protein
MTQLRCQHCQRRMGRRSHPVLFYAAFILCRDCATSPAAHRHMFPNCTRNHIPREHGGDTTTLGRARQSLAAPTWG